MPEMDGIALSKIRVGEYPDVKIIMISGYDEFEYARQAMRMGVQDYLLKPVDIDELIQLVEKVKAEMKTEQKEKQNRKQNVMRQYLAQQLFQLPYSGNSENEINLAGEYCLLVIERKNYVEMRGNHVSWQQILQEVTLFNDLLSICVETHENQFVICFYHEYGLLDEKMEGLLNQLTTVFDERLLLAFSSCFSDLKHAGTYYQELNRRLSFYRGSTKQIVTDMETVKHTSHYEMEEKVVTDLTEAIFQQAQSTAEKIIETLFDDFTREGLQLETIRQLVTDLLLLIKERGQNSMFSEVSLAIEEEIDVLIYNSTDAMKQLVVEDLDQLIACFQDTNENHWIIQQVRLYIEKNYQKDIKAIDVAEAHYITPNYFSLLFKQETGSNYSEYLNKVRINKAKELLLETSNKVFEIAEFVGYSEYKYFVQVFKNHVGITPTQFRKKQSIKK